MGQYGNSSSLLGVPYHKSRNQHVGSFKTTASIGSSAGLKDHMVGLEGQSSSQLLRRVKSSINSCLKPRVLRRSTILTTQVSTQQFRTNSDCLARPVYSLYQLKRKYQQDKHRTSLLETKDQEILNICLHLLALSKIRPSASHLLKIFLKTEP